MTTSSAPNPALVAAAPTLIQALTLIQTFVNTTFTGDPALIPARADASADILLGNLKLLLPGLAVAEVGVVQSDINTKIGAVITQLQNLSAPPAAPAA